MTETEHWRQEIDSSGYELQICSDTHWKIYAYDTRFDVWPTTGKWLEKGKKSVIGFESFRERLDELGEESGEVMSRKEKRKLMDDL